MGRSIMAKRLAPPQAGVRQEGARCALLTLTAINLLNFVDRYVPSSVKELLKDDLNLTDTQTALPTTGMIAVYMIFALIFGMLADKDIMDRRKILSMGIVVWSFATSLAGVANSITTLVLFRSLVGVGEAAYGTIAPPMIGDYYPLKERNTAYTLFYLAIPVGGALGYAAGALIGAAYGWRVAFYICGIPGLIAAYAILRVKDPPRGINDRKLDGSDDEQDEGFIADAVAIVTNPHYMFATAGLICNSFAIGGIADWIDTFLLRYDNSPLSEAGIVVGAATFVGGVVGNLIGSNAANYFEPKIKSSFFLLPAIFTLPAAYFAAWALNTNDKYTAYTMLFIAEIFLWTYISPLSTLSISVIPPHLRARSTGIQIFLLHILGDVISPPIIGAISDSTGSLRAAMQISWVFILLSGMFWGLGYKLLAPLPTSRDGAADSGEDGGEGTVGLGALLCGEQPTPEMLGESDEEN